MRIASAVADSGPYQEAHLSLRALPDKGRSHTER